MDKTLVIQCVLYNIVLVILCILYCRLRKLYDNMFNDYAILNQNYNDIKNKFELLKRDYNELRNDLIMIKNNKYNDDNMNGYIDHNISININIDDIIVLMNEI